MSQQCPTVHLKNMRTLLFIIHKWRQTMLKCVIRVHTKKYYCVRGRVGGVEHLLINQMYCIKIEHHLLSEEYLCEIYQQPTRRTMLHRSNTHVHVAGMCFNVLVHKQQTYVTSLSIPVQKWYRCVSSVADMCYIVPIPMCNTV